MNTINILDSATLISLQNDGFVVARYHSCFITEEVQNEFQVSRENESYLGRCSFVSLEIDNALYLQAYKRTLNKYNLLSFYNLKGVGDMSILATSCAWAENATNNQPLFPSLVPRLKVVTDDRGLTKVLKKEFPSGSLVTVQTTAEWRNEMQTPLPFPNNP